MPRQLHVALALALLGLALCAEAAQLTWTGCNTDFNNPKNWAAAQKVPWTRATGESPATTVDVGRSTRINDPTAGVNTFVEQGVYKVRQRARVGGIAAELSRHTSR